MEMDGFPGCTPMPQSASRRGFSPPVGGRGAVVAGWGTSGGMGGEIFLLLLKHTSAAKGYLYHCRKRCTCRFRWPFQTCTHRPRHFDRSSTKRHTYFAPVEHALCLRGSARTYMSIPAAVLDMHIRWYTDELRPNARPSMHVHSGGRFGHAYSRAHRRASTNAG